MAFWSSAKKDKEDGDKGDNKADGDSGPDLRQLLAQLLKAIEQQLEAPADTGRSLSYENAIGWFVDNRPAKGKASSGAILRRRIRDGRTEIIQVFLDDGNGIVCHPGGRPYGRRVLAGGLDEELNTAFGGADLLIVK